jgi:hypothetical protein
VEVSSFDDACSRELRLTADSMISLTRIAARIPLPSHRPKLVAGREVMGREAQKGVASKADLSA